MTDEIKQGDVVSWLGRYGRMWGWLVRHDGDDCVVETRHGITLRIPCRDITKEEPDYT